MTDYVNIVYPPGTIVETHPDTPVDGQGGRWDWFRHREAGVLYEQWPYWTPDPTPPAEQVAVGEARSALTDAGASQTQLMSRIEGLRSGTGLTSLTALRTAIVAALDQQAVTNAKVLRAASRTLDATGSKGG